MRGSPPIYSARASREHRTDGRGTRVNVAAASRRLDAGFYRTSPTAGGAGGRAGPARRGAGFSKLSPVLHAGSAYIKHYMNSYLRITHIYCTIIHSIQKRGGT